MKNLSNKVQRLVNETQENYDLRILFIELNKPKTAKDLNSIIMYSKIFINIITLGCRYEAKVEKALNKNSNKVKALIKKNIHYIV